MPNNSISGLMIMYVLYVVSKLPIVPIHLREIFKQHLAWIGRVMGIGQASLLADVSICNYHQENGDTLCAKPVVYLAFVRISQGISC